MISKGLYVCQSVCLRKYNKIHKDDHIILNIKSLDRKINIYIALNMSNKLETFSVPKNSYKKQIETFVIAVESFADTICFYYMEKFDINPAQLVLQYFFSGQKVHI